MGVGRQAHQTQLLQFRQAQPGPLAVEHDLAGGAAARRLGEQGADAVPGVGGDVLQVVAELQGDAPGKSKLSSGRREFAGGQAGVGEDGRSALLEDDFEDEALPRW